MDIVLCTYLVCVCKGDKKMDELKDFKNLVTDSYLVNPRTPQLYLWTERSDVNDLD